jgi:hypothetical protein
VIHWLNSKLNNCEIVAKSSSNCGVLSETTNVTKNANVKSVEKFSTSTPATAETVWLLNGVLCGKILIYTFIIFLGQY